MDYKYPFLLFLFLFTKPIPLWAQVLTKKEIIQDLNFLDHFLQQRSSYQGLNGYHYQDDFKYYLDQLDEKDTPIRDFGLFLSKTIGKIGDRHANVREFDLPETLYLPFTFAPFEKKVLVLKHQKPHKIFAFWDAEYPYLKSINHIPIKAILPEVLPEEIHAPTNSYALRALRDLRDIETVFYKLGKELPNPLPITLSSQQGHLKEIEVELVDEEQKAYLWDERFKDLNFFLEEQDFNDPKIIENFFEIEDNISYIQLVQMLNKYSSPTYFEYLNKFMNEAHQSDALIIDVRDNGGGTRDLIQELAGFLIHPDSIYVVNIARQRGELPLKRELKKDLHNRYLYSKDELDSREQVAVDAFMETFHPVYELDKDKFSEYHFHLLNGEKLGRQKKQFDKPIYILANERTFSAASILVSTFKSLPNIKIVGVTTDGSSGNSHKVELPHSGLSVKTSTMVSFQKDGKLLDGVGTSPDIELTRSLDQIFFQEDYQLQQLKAIIQEKHSTFSKDLYHGEHCISGY
ncbi:S41 family peptidase [Algoriphagus halophilus]|uniref:Peptidase family S41 n=1 Tax=Algoriphagus halophilus TaxID=226505 RepID=A0A1N6DQI6_9BACT|nr:S41 family peptidase [Algoriphagus halophilus]SIN73020.1 Peptidase family S41 [Algoriphagus halophilus]